MLTGNREFNESYENYKNLILRRHILIQAIERQQRTLRKRLF